MIETPMHSDELKGRLSLAIDRIGSVKRAAEFARVSEDSLVNWREGRTKPSFFGIYGLASAAGLSLDWIATGDGAMYRTLPDRSVAAAGSDDIECAAASHGMPAKVRDGFSFIPRLNVEASAGAGAIVDHEHVTDYVAFRTAWLRDIGAQPDMLAIVRARGDSMKPTLSEGDALLVDTSINRLQDDTIYIVCVEGQILVKRLQRTIGGGVEILSDNPAYRPQSVTPAELESGLIRIAGRVLWVGHRI